MKAHLVASIMLFDEAITSIELEDRIQVPSQRTITDSGQMLVPCKFARTGVQKYLAKQVFHTKALLDQEGLKEDDVIELHRDEEAVFDEKSVESFRSSPVTIGHPKDEAGSPIQVTAENSKELQVGVLEGMPVRDEDTLGGTLVLTAQEAIDAVEGGKQELSAGYSCDIIKKDNKYHQRNITANHIAIVPKGRAGSRCRIADEEDKLLLDEESLERINKLELQVDNLTVYKDAIALLCDKLEASQTELVTQKEVVVDLKDTIDRAEIKLTSMKAELDDAKTAAKEGVIERCRVLESARLIADMRDLGDKSINEIKKLVVEDQYPDKDYSGKKSSFFDAMFEILEDTAKGETPMSKLLRGQGLHLTVDAKPVDKVKEARLKMIKRNKELHA